MAQRGGPWRLGGDALTDGPADAEGRCGHLAAGGNEHGLRWIMSVYVLAVVGAMLIALVGLSEG
jgi:hypothetical protein